MIRVAVEIDDGADSFRTAVWAQSIQRALSLVGVRYPESGARVLFPIEPEDFFVGDSVEEALLPEVPAGA